MDFTVKLEDIEVLITALKDKATLDDVKNVVKMNGSELQRRMVRNASFKGHFRGKKFIKPTGTTKRSIGIRMDDGGFTVKVAPATHYSPYLEYGTRRMASQSFVRPALNAQKGQFKTDLQRLMK